VENGAWLGWIGGIGGSLIGIAGGVLGSYCSLRATNGPREKAFVWRMIGLCVLLVAAFLVALFVTPVPYKWFLWLPYPILLITMIRWANRTQQRIRAEEAGEAAPPGAAGQP
jgi:hypothetical protein